MPYPNNPLAEPAPDRTHYDHGSESAFVLAFFDIVLYRTDNTGYPLISSKNQSAKIKATINSFLDQGLTDKQVIYNKVVDELGVPRPTVRRVARDLRNELLEKINVLQSTMPREAAGSGASGGARD